MKNLILFIILTVSVLGCAVKPDNIVYKRTDSTVVISPTWGQSFDYASQRDDHDVWIIITAVLFVALTLVFYGSVADEKWFPKMKESGLAVLLFVLLGAMISSFMWQPAQIKWNNDKEISKNVYDSVMKHYQTTAPIWEEFKNKCLIIGGPYNCYNK